MSDRRRWQLEGDLRQAIENYHGGAIVSGPWDKVIEGLAHVIDTGSLNTQMAAHIDLHLTLTLGPESSPDDCPVCDKPLVR